MEGQVSLRVFTHSSKPQGLAEAGYELVSTGGSAKAIEAAGVPVKSVDQLTGFPEMLDGMPLTQLLHPCNASLGKCQCLQRCGIYQRPSNA